MDDDEVGGILGVEPAGDSKERRSLSSGDRDLAREEKRKVSPSERRGYERGGRKILTAEPVMKPVQKGKKERERLA